MTIGRIWTRWAHARSSRRRRPRSRAVALASAESLETRLLLAARSVDVTFINLTQYDLNFVRGDISHGVWSNGVLPPATIKAFQTVEFASESDGVLTGTEAEEVYQVGFTGQEVDIHWDSPYVGDQSYSEAAPVGFRISHVVIVDGHNSQIAYLFSPIDDDSDFVPDVWETESYSASFTNNTGSPLVLTNQHLSNTAWRSGQAPPSVIDPGATVSWSARSNYFPPHATGDLTYTLMGTPFTFQLSFDVAFNGFQTDTFNSLNPDGFPLVVVATGSNNALVSYGASIQDTDGDGLPDVWETNGINYNGTIYKLPGANPNHKDVYVEVDAMSQDLDGSGTIGVTNEAAIGKDFNLDGTISATTQVNENLGPAPGVLQAVASAFASAPVSNPDGTTGITLHVSGGANGVDDASIPEVPWGATNSTNVGPNFTATKAAWFGTQAERSAPNSANILAAKALAYHYCVFANNQGATTTPPKMPGGTPTISPNGSSGLGDVTGNNFMITLGDWSTPGGTAEQQEGTFMHELGHNLGLGHGGGDGINNKPNYDSVMNYTWQVPLGWMTVDPNGNTVPSVWQLDYSRAAFLTLDESKLDETKGIGGTPGRFVQAGPDTNIRNVWETGPVDWNGDKDGGADTKVAVDINRLSGDTNGDGVTDSNDGSPGDTLTGYNDWANIKYNFRVKSNLLAGQIDDTEPELTFEQFQVLNDDTTTQVTSGRNPSTYGQSVTFTATVAAINGSPLPGGSVQFFDGGTPLGSPVPISGGTATFATTRLTAGSHTITAAYSGGGVFQASTSDGLSQDVKRAPLTVTADDATRTYGSPNSSFTGTITGIQNGDNITATYSTTATPSSDVGTYPIVPTLLDPDGRLTNYDVTPNNGTLTITKAHLTVTADDQTKILHAANPPLTATITGFVLNQTLSTSGVTGSPVLSTTATDSSPVGKYPITVSIGTLAAKNYDFTVFQPGTLYITYAIQIDFDPDQAKNPTSTIPIKIRLVDAFGVNQSSGSIGVVALSVTSVADPTVPLPVQSPGSSQPDDNFRLTGDSYQFNLKNTGRAAGKYQLMIAIDGDPLVHSISFLLD